MLLCLMSAVANIVLLHDYNNCVQSHNLYYMAMACAKQLHKSKEGNSGGASKAGYTSMLCTKSINIVCNDVIQHLWAEYPAVAPHTVIGTASVHRWHKGGA
jgi:hypothetical protein